MGSRCQNASCDVQVKVVDRDGADILECSKGDMYIVDLARTTGHVAVVNAALWHPHARHHFITGSMDRCALRPVRVGVGRVFA